MAFDFNTPEEFRKFIEKLQSALMVYYFIKTNNMEPSETGKKLFKEVFGDYPVPQETIRKIIENWWIFEIVRSCEIRKIPANISIAAVTYDKSGKPILFIEPAVLRQLDWDNLLTVLEHEMKHLLSYHPARSQKVYEEGKIGDKYIKELISKRAYLRLTNYIADALIHNTIDVERIEKLAEEWSKIAGKPIKLVPPMRSIYPNMSPQDSIFEKVIIWEIVKFLAQQQQQQQFPKSSSQRGKGSQEQCSGGECSRGGGGEAEGVEDEQGGEQENGKEQSEQTKGEKGKGKGKSEKKQKEALGGESEGEEEGEEKEKEGKGGKGKEKKGEEKQGEKGESRGKDEGEEDDEGKITEGDLSPEQRNTEIDFDLPDGDPETGKKETNRVIKEALQRARELINKMRNIGIGTVAGDWERILDFIESSDIPQLVTKNRQAVGTIYSPRAVEKRVSPFTAKTFLPTLTGPAGNILIKTRHGIGRILVAIDTSGSVEEKDIQRFMNIILKSASRKMEVYVVQIDAELQKINNRYIHKHNAIFIRTSGRRKPGVTIKGGGGTDFRDLGSKKLYDEMVKTLPRLSNGKYFTHVILLTDGQVDKFPLTPPEWSDERGWIGFYTVENPTQNSPSWIKWFDLNKIGNSTIQL